MNETGNSTNNTVNIYYFFETEQFIALSILFVVIIVGNIAVLYVLTCGRTRKSRMNFFITHLAIADLAVGLLNVLADILVKVTIEWYGGNAACKALKFLQVVVTYAATYVLVALSLDRYDAIRHPMKFTGSWKRAKYLILAAWLFSLLFAVPILIFYQEEFIRGKVQCWIDFKFQWQWQLYMSLVSISLFIIPAIIIASCYAVILFTIWSKNKKIFAKNNKFSDGVDNNLRRVSSRGLIPRAKVKTVKITLVIITVFIICWSPYIIFNLLQVFRQIPENQTNVAIATFIQSLAPLNSAANPIIYFMFSTHLCRLIWTLPPFNWFTKGRNKITSDLTNNTHSSSLGEFITHNTKSSSDFTSKPLSVFN